VTLNRAVAVKVLKPELVSDQKFLATFLHEAEITASINHPNIVQVYAFGQHEGVYYMVVEYIQGGSLDDRMAKLGRITELEGIEIGLAVARGLECALQRGGLIHRDIKPGNILFNAHNTPKVVDFGLSLSYDTTDHFDGEIWGTPYYVAPEKLEREKETFQSDLYSLGATLFHAISGRPAYEGKDPNDVAMKHLRGNVVSLKAFVPDISDQTAFAVSKAMARYPEDRYESYAAFIEQLEDAKRRITDPNFRTTQKKDVAILESAEGAKHTMWLIIGMVAIIVIALGLFIWRGTSLFKPRDATASSPEELTDYAPLATTAKPATAKTTAAKPATPKKDAALKSSGAGDAIILYVSGSTGITVNGDWTKSISQPGYHGSYYLNDGNAGGGKSVQFTPAIPTAGSYRVYASWTSDNNRSSKVPFTIVSAGGTQSTVYVNQQENGGKWVSLGTYSFDAGTGGSVTVSDTGGTSFVIADAVEFVPQ